MRLHDVPMMSNRVKRDLRFPVKNPVFYSLYTLCACMLSCFSCVQLFATLWTVPRQAPLSMGFSRQEYQSGLPCPTPGDLPYPGIEPVSLVSPALAGGFFTTRPTWEAQVQSKYAINISCCHYCLYHCVLKG